MATREESLKKINAELEKLSDDELEQVAGGFYARSNVGDVKPDANIENKNNKTFRSEDKNYKAHEDAIKKIPPITIIPIPMIPITQPISPPKI